MSLYWPDGDQNLRENVPATLRNEGQFCAKGKNDLLCLKQLWWSTEDGLETEGETQKSETDIKKMQTFSQVLPKDQ